MVYAKLIRWLGSNRKSPLWCQCVGCFCLVLFAIPSSSCLGQTETLSDQEWKRGYHGLAVICRSQGLTLLNSIEDWSQAPRDETLLVLLGGMEDVSFDLYGYLNNGGAVLVASDRISERWVNQLGMGIVEGPLTVANEQDAYFHDDCPIVKPSPGHPTTEGVNDIIGNRCGMVLPLRPTLFPRAQVNVIAKWPPVRSERRQFSEFRNGPSFAVGMDARDGRAMVVADQSVFSNQMLVHGDNAQWAIQSIDWLSRAVNSDSRRTRVLLVADSRVINPLSPEQVQVQLPPPNPSDVAAAIRSLPPDVLLDFANSVVDTVQQESIINEMMIDYERNYLSARQRRRFILISLACLIGSVVAWRILTGGNTNDRARQSTNALGEVLVNESTDVAYERFLAAHELVRVFQAHVGANREVVADRSLPVAELIVAGNNWETRRYRRQLRSLLKKIHRFHISDWNEASLVQVETLIEKWRRWYDTGILVKEADSPHR